MGKREKPDLRFWAGAFSWNMDMSTETTAH